MVQYKMANEYTDKYVFVSQNVKKVYDSFGGSHWIVTEEDDEEMFSGTERDDNRRLPYWLIEEEDDDIIFYGCITGSTSSGRGYDPYFDVRRQMYKKVVEKY